MAQLPLSIKVIEALMGYDYPGNVRELRNILERASVLAGDDMIQVKHLRFDSISVHNPQASASLENVNGKLSVKEERILSALKNNAGNRSKAARSLGMSERTIYRHVRQIKERLGEDALGLD